MDNLAAVWKGMLSCDSRKSLQYIYDIMQG